MDRWKDEWIGVGGWLDGLLDEWVGSWAGRRKVERMSSWVDTVVES